MKKAQMFIVTMIFLVGMISVIQQSLFIYSSVDLSDPPRSSDFYIVENFRRIGEDTVKTSSICEFDKPNSLEYNIEELVSFINFQKPKEGFSIAIDSSVNCTYWNTTQPVLNMSVDIFGKNIQTQGGFGINSLGSFFPPPPVCGDGFCSAGETCSADDSACNPPPVCSLPGACSNGCEYTFISDGQEDFGRCDYSGSGCPGASCACDGSGGCVTVNIILVSGCQELNQTDTIYRLNQSISSPGNTCFRITADNITLDGAGFNINGDGSIGTHGALAHGVANITIKNLNITNFERGIFFNDVPAGGVNNSLVFNNTVNSNSNYGISIKSSFYNTIQENTVNYNGVDGILFESSPNNQIINNTANSNSQHGMFLQSSSNNNTIRDNTALSNTQHGIRFTTNSNDNLITNNNLSSNGRNGIDINSCNNNIIQDNVLNSNTENGIKIISNAVNNQLINNTAMFNTLSGIRLQASSNNNQIISNNLTSNANYGIILDSSSSNIIQNNTANSNGGPFTPASGIYLISSTNNQLTNNTANFNEDNGIQLDTSLNNNLTNNTANSNTKQGIYIISSNRSTLQDNIATLNSLSGIRMESSSNNTLTRNNASFNIKEGINMLSSTNNNITDNIVSSNTEKGIRIQSSSNSNIVRNNIANSNSNGASKGEGIYIASSTSNTITDNIACNNLINDFFCSSAESNTGSGNKFDTRQLCAWADVGKISCSQSQTTVQLQSPDTEILEDARTNEYAPDTNYGNNAFMRIGTNNVGIGKATRGWMKFNISAAGIPLGSTIIDAQNCGWVYINHYTSSPTIYVWGVMNQIWSENQITYNTEPAVDGGLINSNNTLGAGTINVWLCFDVTSWVQNQISAGNKNITFMWNGTIISTHGIQIRPKEYTAALERLYLNITYDNSTACDGVFNGSCWYNGIQGDSCDTVCQNVGKTCVQADWNDDTSCTVCRNFHPGGASCIQSPDIYTPAYLPLLDRCIYRSPTVSQNCIFAPPAYERQCVCE